MSLVNEIKFSTTPFFFLKAELEEKEVTLPTEITHHLKVKRKLKENQKVYLSNNTFIAQGRLIFPYKNEPFVEIEQIEACEKRELKTFLYASLIKEDLYHLIVEKAVELGIDVITPLITEYTQHKKINKEKILKKIALAAGQSRQTTLPVFKDPIYLKQFNKNDFSHIFVADWKEASSSLPTSFSKHSTVALLTGPEGGWSANEKQLLSFACHLCLSSHILRAETAAIALMTLTQFSRNLSQVDLK
jgi:RsmE family RNA methyltransferase